MAQAQLETVVRRLHGLAASQRVRELSDADLLQRFARQRDEAAFAVLLERHGGLVWTVCRRVLRSAHDAEDAFQATFLLLARHAASIRAGQAVASWLYHVASRTAQKARTDSTRRQAQERKAATMPRADLDTDLAWRELQTVLDEELQRLPEKYRAPFVLCCLEGKTRPEAAQALGWKEGTVSGRLARARKELQDRLARRGVSLAAVLTAGALASPSAAAPPALVHVTLAALGSAADRVPAAIAALVEGVTRTMPFAPARLSASLVLLAGLLLAGSGLVTYRALAAPADDPAPRAKTDTPPPADDADRIEVKGRVTGPDDKPFAGARIQILDKVHARSAADGTYRFVVSKKQLMGGYTPDPNLWVWTSVLAIAPGHGIDWKTLGERDRKGELNLRLVKEMPVEGRILDLEGRPVAGATVRVVRLSASPDGNLNRFLKAWPDGPTEAMAGQAQLRMEMPGRRPQLEQAPQWRRLWQPWKWNLLPTVTTDKEGRFRLTGVGPEQLVELQVKGDSIAQEELRIITRKGIDVKALAKPGAALLQRFGGGRPFPFPSIHGPAFEHLAGPGRVITGTITDRATGKPVAGLAVTGRGGTGFLAYDVEAVTDDKGVYRLTGLGKSQQYVVRVDTLAGLTYLPQHKEIDDAEGLRPIRADVELERGVVVEGKLVDHDTGKPVAGWIHYAPLPGNARYQGRFGRSSDMINRSVATDENGRYKLLAYPGVGVVYAHSSADRYLSAVVSDEDRKKGFGGTGPDALPFAIIRTHAYRVIEPEEKVRSLKVDLKFHTPRKASGTITGPDGKPLVGATGFVLRERPAQPWAAPRQLRIDKDGSFELEGADPRVTVRAMFVHKERKLAGLAEIRVGAKTTAKLAPWISVTGRVLDPDGKPLAGATVQLEPRTPDGKRVGPGELPGRRVETDKEGRFTVEGMPAGFPVGLYVLTAPRDGDQPILVRHASENLECKPGEPRDLGDLRLKPHPRTDR